MEKKDLLKKLRKDRVPDYLLEVFEKVPRENFVPPKTHKAMIYENLPLDIGYNQTISQPFTIAVMLNLLDLKKGQKVLEVGSGCGYVLALISEITKSKVYGIEKIKKLAEQSKENLKDYDVEIYNKNGAEGLGEKAPYDRILISASCEKIPKTLLNQLTDNGILVAPVRDNDEECSLIKIQREGSKFIEKDKIPHFSFVKFVEE